MQTKNHTDSYICMRVKNGFHNQFWMVQIFLVSHNFHEPSEAVPGFLDGVTTRYYDLFLMIFLSVSYYINNAMLTTTPTNLSS